MPELTEEDLAFAGVARQAELVRTGEVSPTELVELCLARIERARPSLNAFRLVLAERALAEARQAEDRRGGGAGAAGDQPLLGVPVAVKDNVDVAGELTCHGTDAYTRPAASDAEIVRRLRAAGAIVVGKTHMPELAIHGFTESATFGVSRNPWDRDRTTGGSSGGSAAAVAAGLVPAATASDGAGSIRIPAACCGVLGLKPTRDLIDLAPLLEHWHGMSVLGFHTRSVLDTALMLDATAARAPERPFAEAARAAPGKLRIGTWTRTPVPGPLGEEQRAAVESTAGLLRSLGHRVSERKPAWERGVNGVTLRYLRGIHDDIAGVPRPERLERRTRGYGRLGALVHPAMVRRAREAEPVWVGKLEQSLRDTDLLMTPLLPGPVPEVGAFEGTGALRSVMGQLRRLGPYTAIWNSAGWPAASVPAGFGTDGLPLAVQLIARAGGEALLLSVAAQLEAERPWAEARPAL